MQRKRRLGRSGRRRNVRKTNNDGKRRRKSKRRTKYWHHYCVLTLGSITTEQFLLGAKEEAGISIATRYHALRDCFLTCSGSDFRLSAIFSAFSCSARCCSSTNPSVYARSFDFTNFGWFDRQRSLRSRYQFTRLKYSPI